MHGKPRLETCKTCNTYGYIPRFSKSICPKCGSVTTAIDKDTLCKRMNIYWPKQLPFSFDFKPID